MNNTELQQVLDALSSNRVMAKNAAGNYTREVTPKLITDAIALCEASLARAVEPVVRYEPERYDEDRVRMALDSDGDWVRYSDYLIAFATPQAAAPFKGPAKWTDDEIKAGLIGIRWIAEDGVHGRPTDHDVREYLQATSTADGCHCEDCKAFYTQAAAQPPAPGEAAREYMTGYSDCKEWAQPSQELERVKEEQRLLHRGWFGHRDTGHLSFTEAVEKTMCELYDELERVNGERDVMAAKLAGIVALGPSKDSDEGYNEWGEADCFRKAQVIAAQGGKA